ncbi:uncharacterized protein DUF3124 [Maribacter vaceletii]|uniref:Uncharacterized protein DUF3124 n=1 Tax=Maribacter vaceletii TaxID=1206816 RepID=A0A495E7I2_9FLAO|nr:DUF3124 domain-containing protein [Maribacter vaceletii]RKR12902.1 uncharacterized protein DUF3124 [Maribacter vaceletii]
MKRYIPVILLFFVFLACEKKKELSSVATENWTKRAASTSVKDSLEYGKSYLSIYSQIYSLSEHKRHNLTAMVSLRNTSDKDTIYLLNSKYFDTHGKLIRSYFDFPIYLAPMETTEIIIEEGDVSGGTGSNFLIEWKKQQKTSEPLFEAVMSSTLGQQGLSFTTQAKRIE